MLTEQELLKGLRRLPRLGGGRVPEVAADVLSDGEGLAQRTVSPKGDLFSKVADGAWDQRVRTPVHHVGPWRAEKSAREEIPPLRDDAVYVTVVYDGGGRVANGLPAQGGIAENRRLQLVAREEGLRIAMLPRAGR